MRSKVLIWIALLGCSTISYAQQLLSPDGNLEMNFRLDEKGAPVYDLSYKQKEVIKPSHLGLELKKEDADAAVDFEFKQRKDVDALDKKRHSYFQFQ